MNIQAENQASAAARPLPAPIALVPPAQERGSFRKESKPRRRTQRAKRNRPQDQRKPKAKSGAEIRSMPALLRSSPKKKNRIPSAQPIEPTAIDEQAAVCEVRPEQAAPLAIDAGVDPMPLSESEIQTESCVPAENHAPLWVRSEPDQPGEETIALAKTDMPGLGAPAPQGEKGRLLTVTLRIRRSPLAFVLKAMDSLLTQAWNWTQQKLKSSGGKKRLRVCESVSLGEKRFVAVIQVDGEQFLVGGSANSVSTLAHLERPREFSDVFQRHCKQDLSPA